MHFCIGEGAGGGCVRLKFWESWPRKSDETTSEGAMVWPHSSMLLTLPFVSGQGAESSGGASRLRGA